MCCVFQSEGEGTSSAMVVEKLKLDKKVTAMKNHIQVGGTFRRPPLGGHL